MKKKTKKVLIVSAVVFTITVGTIAIFNRKKIISFVLKKEQEIFISKLHPSVREKFRQFIAVVESKGYNVIVTSGYRSFAEQSRLKSENPKNATPGLSTHNYGMSIDVNLQRGARLWRKATDKADWMATGVPAIGEAMGLFWGGNFKNYFDPVHFELRVDTTALLAMAKKQFGTNPETIRGNELKLS